MIKTNINTILNDLKHIEDRFSKEELANTNDDSIRWIFYDIRSQIDSIEAKNNRFREMLENTIRNHYDWL
tara:strand:- start:756 stop:965 length:210 start_codon:yes stop_codon:yes gene_type:complete